MSIPPTGPSQRPHETAPTSAINISQPEVLKHLTAFALTVNLQSINGHLNLSQLESTWNESSFPAAVKTLLSKSPFDLKAFNNLFKTAPTFSGTLKGANHLTDALWYLGADKGSISYHPNLFDPTYGALNALKSYYYNLNDGGSAAGNLIKEAQGEALDGSVNSVTITHIIQDMQTPLQ